MFTDAIGSISPETILQTDRLYVDYYAEAFTRRKQYEEDFSIKDPLNGQTKVVVSALLAQMYRIFDELAEITTYQDQSVPNDLRRSLSMLGKAVAQFLGMQPLDLTKELRKKLYDKAKVQ